MHRNWVLGERFTHEFTTRWAGPKCNLAEFQDLSSETRAYQEHRILNDFRPAPPAQQLRSSSWFKAWQSDVCKWRHTKIHWFWYGKEIWRRNTFIVELNGAFVQTTRDSIRRQVLRTKCRYMVGWLHPCWDTDQIAYIRRTNWVRLTKQNFHDPWNT